MARPSKLTPETQDKIVQAISAGNYYEAACQFAGIDYRTFRNWMERGEAAKTGKFFQFFHAIRQAEAEAEVRVVAQWQKNIPNSWQAARDFLARRHPQRWMHKEGREESGDLKVIVEYADSKDNSADPA